MGILWGVGDDEAFPVLVSRLFHIFSVKDSSTGAIAFVITWLE